MDRVLDYDPLSGMTVLFSDHPDGTFSITHVQDTNAVIESNKVAANSDSLTKKGIKKGMWHYATIPPIVLMKWSKEVGGDILQNKYKKELFKRLNMPEYKYLKTTNGRHTVKN